MSADRSRPADHPSLHVIGGVVLQPSGPGPADVVITGERIESIVGPGVGRADSGAIIDATDLLVAPGLIDLQINGGYGHDLWSDPASLWDLAAILPRHGVTAFCPTIISGPPDRIAQAKAVLVRRPGPTVGAEPLGLHLEGPILAQARRGAHDRRHLTDADPTIIANWTRDSGVRLVTLAPELPGALDLIRQLTEAGVVVAAGHSDASAEQAALAVDAGVTLVTHLFNAMAPLHHREPGLVGFTLASDTLAAGLIVDGIHLAKEVVTVAFRSLGPERFVLVTDAVAAMGLPPGTHHLGRGAVTAGPDGVRRADGTLAGSDLTLDQAVRNLVNFTGCTVAEAIGAASTNSARVVGEAGRGRLEAGATADIVLLDHELQVVATLCRGRMAHLDRAASGRISGVAVPPSALA